MSKNTSKRNTRKGKSVKKYTVAIFTRDACGWCTKFEENFEPDLIKTLKKRRDVEIFRAHTEYDMTGTPAEIDMKNAGAVMNHLKSINLSLLKYVKYSPTVALFRTNNIKNGERLRGIVFNTEKKTSIINGKEIHEIVPLADNLLKAPNHENINAWIDLNLAENPLFSDNPPPPSPASISSSRPGPLINLDSLPASTPSRPPTIRDIGIRILPASVRAAPVVSGGALDSTAADLVAPKPVYGIYLRTNYPKIDGQIPQFEPIR